MGIVSKILVVFLLATGLGYSQSAQRTSVAIQSPVAATGYAKLIPHAAIYVCTYNTQLNCSSGNYISIYSDVGLTSGISQPLVADSVGGYQYYVQAGTQVVEKVCYTGVQCQSYGVYIGNSNLSISGNGAPTQTCTPSNLGQLYVDIGSGNIYTCNGTSWVTGGGGAFLPLVGGVLTGPVTGTDANFSGTVAVGTTVSAPSVVAKGNPEYNIMAFGAVCGADSTAPIQAAIDALPAGQNPATGNYKVVIPPCPGGVPYIVSSPLLNLHRNVELVSTGGILYCTITPCIHDGNGGTANYQYSGNVYENLRIAAGAANDPGSAAAGVGAAIFLDGWKASIINPQFLENPYAASCAGVLLCDTGNVSGGYAPRPLTKYFAYDVQLNNDQSAKITGMDLNVHNLRCDSTFCGSAIYNPNISQGAAVGWITNSNLSMACQGNGIDWQYGNNLHVSSGIIQSFSEFAFRHNLQGAGGEGAPLFDHVHIEQGGCLNPALNNLTAGAGFIMDGGNVKNNQSEVSANFPAFTVTNPGTTNYAYYVVLHNGAGNNNWAAPLAVGYVANGNATLGTGGAQVNVVIPTVPNPFTVSTITAYSINSSSVVTFTAANTFSTSIGATVTISGTGVAFLDGVTAQVTSPNSTSFSMTIAGSYAACTSASNCTGSGLTATATPYTIKGDLLRVNQTANGHVAPYSGNAFAVATNLNVDATSAGAPFITYTDTTPDASLTTYTAAWGTYNAGYTPAFNFWPGSVVLGASGTGRGGAFVGTYTGLCHFMLFNNAAQPGYGNINGPNVFCLGPTLENFATDKTPASTAWQSFPNGGYNAITNTTSALSLPLQGAQGNGTNLKGVINLGVGASSRWTIGPTDAITVVDSNTGKTIATPGNRPSPDAADVAVGIDQARVGLALRDPTSISFYINSLFDGTSWLERLTSTTKTFKVPVTITGLNVAGYVKNSSAGLLSTSPNVPDSDVVGTPSTLPVCHNGSGGSLTTTGCGTNVLPTGTTATTVTPSSDNTTAVATDAFVQSALSGYAPTTYTCDPTKNACVMANVDLTGQTASISQTNFYTVPSGGAGLYRMNAAFRVTTVGTAGTLSVGVSASGAGLTNSGAFALTSTTANNGASLTVLLNVGDHCQYGTTMSGATGSPVYSVMATCELIAKQ